MKTSLLIRWLFMAGAVFVGLIALMTCNKNEPSEAKKNLEASRQQWEKMKRAKGDSYVYRTTFNSWTGAGHYTEIRVKDGRVTARLYYEIEPRRNDTTGKFVRDTTHIYSESAVDLGTHQAGTAPMTIDELYDMCSRDYLTVDPKQNDINFETDAMDILSSCGYTPKDCVDDCFVGVTVAWIRWEK